MPNESVPPPASIGPEPEWLTLIRAKVRGLRYGVVQLVVHNGLVTQIECTEKTRIASESGNSATGRAASRSLVPGSQELLSADRPSRRL